MKLYNAIVIYDCYVVANDPQEAREAVKAWIKDGMQPTEESAPEVRDQRSVRQSWHDKTPLVGASISDAEFESLKGVTVLDTWKRIYTKMRA